MFERFDRFFFNTVFGNSNHQAQVEVSGGALATGLNSFAFYAQELAALGRSGNFNLYRPRRGRNFYGRAVDRLPDGDR